MARQEQIGAASSEYQAVELDNPEDGDTSQRQEVAEVHHDDDSWSSDEKQTSRLPARPISLERSLWPFAFAFMAAFMTFFTCLILLKYMANFMPDALDESSPAYNDNTISCDLAHKNGSMLENAFLIDLRSPLELSFMQAKAIDIIWDLFIGQGGRLIMAWVSYHVFMDSLVALMEKASVNYDMYTSIAFSTTSLSALWESLKAIFGLRGARAKAFMVWFSISVAYVLSFPILMGAATGYVNPSIASYNMGDGSFVSAGSIAPISCLQLRNGSLIGLKDNETIKGPSILGSSSFAYMSSSGSTDGSLTSRAAYCGRYKDYATGDPFKGDFNHTHQDWIDLCYPNIGNDNPIYDYDNPRTSKFFEATDLKTKTVFNTTYAGIVEKYFKEDGLNASIYTGYNHYRLEPSLTVCSDRKMICEHDSPCSDGSSPSSPYWMNCSYALATDYDDEVTTSSYAMARISDTWYSNLTFRGKSYVFANYTFHVDSSYDPESSGFDRSRGAFSETVCTSKGDPFPAAASKVAQCMPKSYFVWGFSSLVLYIALPIQMVWTMGMFLVWLHAHMTSELLRARRTVHGPFRVVADLAEAMREVLGHEFCNYRDEELHRELRRDGGNLRYYTRDGEEDEVGHIGISSRMDSGLHLKKTKLYGDVRQLKKRKPS